MITVVGEFPAVMLSTAPYRPLLTHPTFFRAITFPIRRALLTSQPQKGPCFLEPRPAHRNRGQARARTRKS